MATPSRSRTAPPLVGRERELCVLRDHLASAVDGHGGLVLISGEAGIGKTALAEALCHEAAEYGALVLIGRCYDLTETPPYGLWVELFAQYQASEGDPLPPAAFARRGSIGEIASQATLFQQVLDFFLTATTSHPLLILLDDLHWADAASLDLLRFLARQIATLPILALVTYRADELHRDHPLYALVPLLVREARSERLDLDRLSIEAMRAFVRARYALSAVDEGRLVAYLAGRTEGNALFATELLRTLEERGVLRDSGGWRLDDLEGVGVPPLLRQVIDGRVARLGEEIRRLLGVAAVIGHAIPLHLWAAVAEADEDALLAAIARAETARIIVEANDGTGAIFTHALIREALYESIRPSQRRQWHRRVGEALASASQPDPDAVASHFQRAGDARARGWLVRAGERAAAAYAWQTAADRFAAALALMDQSEADIGERGWLLYHVGAYRRWTDPASCIAFLAEAEQCAAFVNDRGLDASATFIRGLVQCANGDLKRGLHDMEMGVEARRSLTVSERARLRQRMLAEDAWDKTDGQGTLVQWLATAGRFREARFIGERALAELGATVPLGASHDPSLTDAYYGLAQAYAGLGLVDEALRAYQETRQVYRALGHDPMVGVTAQNEFRWTVSYRADRPAELHHILAEADEVWARAANSVSDWQRRYPHALRFLVNGQWTEARHQLLTGIAPGHQALVRQWLGPIARDQGDTKLAWDFVHAGLPEGAATEPGSCGFHTAVALFRVAAGLALDAGELENAKAWLEAHDRWIRWSESPLGRADGALLWATYHRAAGDGALASQHAEQALKDASNPRQALALLGAHRFLGELATDAGHFDAARTHLDAALALADACALPFERARTLLACAVLHVATGNRTDARALLDEVRAICLPLGAALTLAAVDTLLGQIGSAKALQTEHPAGLSPREVEVIRLIAAGKTNREIAEALFLSPATVNIHITHILTKTDTTNRTEAAAFALRHGLA